MTTVLLRTLSRERRHVLGWVVGVVFVVLITTGSWPAVGDATDELGAVLENMPEAITAFFGEGIADFSAAGVVGSRLYGTIGLALFIAYAVSRGASAIAGEESAGTLELLVTQPISRTSIAVQKVVAMLVALAGLLAVETVLLLVMMPLVGLDFPLGRVVGAAAGLYLLSAMFGALGFAVGAATGNRGAAVGVAGGLAGGLFLLTGFGGLVEALEPIADLSPFSAYDGSVVLADGVGAGPLVTFAAVTILLVVLGILAFTRRDLS